MSISLYLKSLPCFITHLIILTCVKKKILFKAAKGKWRSVRKGCQDGQKIKLSNWLRFPGGWGAVVGGEVGDDPIHTPLLNLILHQAHFQLSPRRFLPRKINEIFSHRNDVENVKDLHSRSFPAILIRLHKRVLCEFFLLFFF